MINRCVLGLAFALASCVQQPPAPPQGHAKFTVGFGYQSQGEWIYPCNFNNYAVTGLATVTGGTHPPMAADGEGYDPNAIAAASPVLQLPSIVIITNLVNGYTMDVRVTDRGPDDPGRVIAVTPKVASLLRFPPDGVVEVAVTLNTQRTAALDASLGEGPKLTASPLAGITAQSLGPPGGAAGGAVNLTPQDATANAADPGQVSGTVTALPPSPGPLFVQIPGFGRPRDTDDTVNALYGMPAFVVPVAGDSRTLYAIRLGPYRSVADADAALHEVLRRGVADPEIIVR